MAFTPSKYQQAVYDFIVNGKGNAVVSAVAGSGKTTTLKNALKLIPSDKQVLFMAFNRSIKDELVEKIEPAANITIRTVHSYGQSSLNRVMDTRPEIEGNKYGKILRSIKEGKIEITDLELRQWVSIIADCLNDNRNDIEMYEKSILELCDFGRLNLISGTINECVPVLEDVAEKYGVTLINGECKAAYALIRLGLALTNTIDYTDMVYMPIVFKARTLKYDFVFIDECQDLNACQRTLMQMALKPDGRFVAVGDPNQAIYGFAGADAQSFEKLCRIPYTIQLPLSVCYRCGSKIVHMAKGIVPQIKAIEGAPEGIIDNDASYLNIKDGDMVVCRNTFPLVSLCMKYLSKGIFDHEDAWKLMENKGLNLLERMQIMRLYKEIGQHIPCNVEMKSFGRGNNREEYYESKHNSLSGYSFRTEKEVELLNMLYDMNRNNDKEDIIKAMGIIFKLLNIKSDYVFNPEK